MATTLDLADGLHDLTADEYHADPVPGGSLSASGAKKLLACPARFNYERTHRPTPTHEFTIGHAAHKLVLGAGADVVIVEADSWRTKDAKEARADAHAKGRIPVLGHEWDEVRAMAAALRQHPLASRLFTDGQPERTLVWTDVATGVRCRAMLDYLRPTWVVDYKTAESSNPFDLDDAVYRYGYDIQAWWYLDGIRTLGLTAEPAFMFVAQEKEPPYLVTVFQLDDEYLRIGASRAQRAREMFRDCATSSIWPGYVPDTEVATIAPPRWVRYQHEEF